MTPESAYVAIELPFHSSVSNGTGSAEFRDPLSVPLPSAVECDTLEATLIASAGRFRPGCEVLGVLGYWDE